MIETEACLDHIQFFVELPPKYSVSGFMGYLKGKSAAMLSGFRREWLIYKIGYLRKSLFHKVLRYAILV